MTKRERQRRVDDEIAYWNTPGWADVFGEEPTAAPTREDIDDRADDDAIDDERAREQLAELEEERR